MTTRGKNRTQYGVFIPFKTRECAQSVMEESIWYTKLVSFRHPVRGRGYIAIKVAEEAKSDE